MGMISISFIIMMVIMISWKAPADPSRSVKNSPFMTLQQYKRNVRHYCVGRNDASNCLEKWHCFQYPLHFNTFFSDIGQIYQHWKIVFAYPLSMLLNISQTFAKCTSYHILNIVYNCFSSTISSWYSVNANAVFGLHNTIDWIYHRIRFYLNINIQGCQIVTHRNINISVKNKVKDLMSAKD